jgi:putative ABC transport system substrate-binding protein
MVPGMRRVAFLANPEHPGEYRERVASQAAADKLRLDYIYFQARNPEELKVTLVAIANAKPDRLVAFGDSLVLQERASIADFMRKSRIPTACGWSEFAESGFLMSYGPDRRASWRRLAYFVDRIIKGTNPGDLPVELPTVIELYVNRTTAKQLNVAIPPSIPLQATRAVD